MYHFGQRPKYTRTKAGALARRILDTQVKDALNLHLNKIYSDSKFSKVFKNRPIIAELN